MSEEGRLDTDIVLYVKKYRDKAETKNLDNHP